jgi:proteasome lid subunit RPN8/RPN11
MNRVSQLLMNEMIAYCRARLPDEACGILRGSSTSGVISVTAFAGIDNQAEDAQRSFVFHPGQWIRQLMAAKNADEQIVGIFHSHPESAAYPSTRDLSGLWTFPTYWIVSFATPGEPDVRAYNITFSPGRPIAPQPILTDCGAEPD